MRTRGRLLLVGGIIVFVALTLFFWTAANLTHLNCCSQEWVMNASDKATRDERTQVRARHITEVTQMKRKSQIYSLVCLAGAVSLIILYQQSRNRADEGRS